MTEWDARRTNWHVRIMHSFIDYRPSEGSMVFYRLWDSGISITGGPTDEKYMAKVHKADGMSTIMLNCIHPDMDQYSLAKEIIAILEEN